MAATRTKHERELDLELINRWYLQGKSLRQIALDLKSEGGRNYEVSFQTIGNDLKELRKRWLETTLVDRREHVAKELAKIDRLEEEYWSQWIASLDPRKITTKSAKLKPGRGDKPDVSEQSGGERIETRDGNPAFLAGVERCIKLRCDLLGLNAPVKQEDTMTIKWEVVRDDDSTGSHKTNTPAQPARGTEDYMQ